MPLEREEFLAYIALLQKSVDEGFDGVHRRQDATNGRINVNEHHIRDLTARVQTVEQNRKTLATIGGAAATIAGAIGAIVGYFSK
jgi:hypothetical protein